MAFGDGPWYWRYLEDGSSKHALRRGTDTAALCTVRPRQGQRWYGAGELAECDRVEQLPRCGRCARVINRQWARELRN